MKKKNTSIKRRPLLGLTLIMLIVFLTTAVFALENISEKIDKIRDLNLNTNVVLHNDYDGGTQKHIYAENLSKTTVVYVRIKISEYLDLPSNGDRVIPGNQWTTHIPDASIADCGLSNPLHKKFHDSITWKLGGQKYYLSTPAASDGIAPSDLGDYSPDGSAYLALDPLAQSAVKQTLPATVITMAEYQKAVNGAMKEEFCGWIYDSDGWAYWNRPLAAGEATGLLLQAITPDPQTAKYDYFYATNVKLEAVDQDDLPMWMIPSGSNDGKGQPSVLDGSQSELATVAAIEFLSDFLQQEPKIVDVLIAKMPDKLAYRPGEYFNPAGLELTVNYDDGTSLPLITGYTVNNSEPLALKDFQVLITYEQFTLSIAIWVNPLANLYDAAVDQIFTIDNAEWQKVKDYLDDQGNQYVLLTTAEPNGTFVSIFNKSNGYYEGSVLQETMTNWYKENLRSERYPTLRDALVLADISEEYSRPYFTLAKTNTKERDVVFALSSAEAQQWSGAKDKFRFWTRSNYGGSYAYAIGKENQNITPYMVSSLNLGRVAFWIKVN